MTTTAVPPALKLHPFQQEALDAVYMDWGAGITPVAVVLPTGSGKTVTFSAVIQRWGERGSSDRPLILVDRDELVKQTAKTLRALCPHLGVGIVKAGQDEVGPEYGVIVASVQTLRQPHRMARLTGIGMIIIDECDLALADGYQRILAHYGAIDQPNPFERIPCLGVTATLERGDGQGFGDLFAKVSYTRDIMWMIRNGYLCDVRGLSPRGIGIDLSRAARRRGDFDEHDLGEIMGQAAVTEAIADSYLQHALHPDGTPRRGVHFAPTVDSAYAQADAYNAAGIVSEVVIGETPLDDRAQIYHRFREGDTRILVNVMVLTRGWDAPWAEVAVMGRPTKVPSLYCQCVGRVLRRWPGKDKALVLDVAGIARQHKLMSLLDMSRADLREDESLLEADEREIEEQDEERAASAGGTAPERKSVKLESGGELHEINLFAQSASAWLRTRKGVWFLATRETTWFLWEDTADSTFGIATYANADYRGKPELSERRGLPMELALSLAESDAMRADPSIAGKSSSWRRNPQPSQAQLDRMARWRIEIPTDKPLTRHGASELIAVAEASARIDRYVR